MSDTPRTDKYGGYCAEYHKVNGMTLIQHARQLERENAELRKDSERLDRLQSSHLALYCSIEGEVWRKEGIYKIREYIDEEMEDAP